jgi:anti-anti-sigma factor
MSEHDEVTMARTDLLITVAAACPEQAVMTLQGRFDVVEAMAVRSRLAEADIVDIPHLLVDLTNVTFIDSAGLAVLARARRDRLLRGGSVTLVRPAAEEAMRVFRLTQFDRIFVMRDQIDGEGAR